ncbi:MAG TPA: glycosyltransferase [Gaiellaceae bacterium]|nr:glycosyltransferase [Gaiellaceae bacterium]
MSPEKIRFVPNGIPDLAPGDRSRARAQLGIPPTAPIVGTVCALRPQKAVDVALEATARLAAERPELRFLVVGDGPERQRLELRAAELGGFAIFLGRRPGVELPDLLAAMDVLVSSSSFEGTPLAVLEWMAAGKAIVATRVGGIPALIEDGVEGLLVPAGDAAALAGAVGHLLDDAAERERLSAAARRRQQAEFRLERTLKVVEELYAAAYRDTREECRESGGGGEGRSR